MKTIIITAAAAVLAVLMIEAALYEVYRAGMRKAEQMHADERTVLQETINEYRLKLADVRIREKLAKAEKK